MARSIMVSLDGDVTSFSYAKLDRAKLYATRKRLPLDAEGNACKRADLSDDGAMLVRSGMTGQGYFDEAGTWIPSKSLIGLDADGNAAVKQPSTLDKPQELTEVGPEALLDAAVTSVYMLDAEEIGASLEVALAEGKLFRFDFNTRADYHMETGYILRNDQGVFVLVGDTVDTPWRELDKPAVLEADTDDTDDDELDFEMF